MLIALHKNATAAPATRLALQQARGVDRELAQQYDIGVDTVSKQDGEHKPFKAYEPGYVHVDVKYLPQMQDEDQRRYVFVAIDNGDTLGAHRHQVAQDGSVRQSLLGSCAQGYSIQDSHHPHRQW